jgi:anti-sigma B factor antagonist
MALNISSEMANGVGKINLAGELDASSAPQFRDEIEALAAQHPRRLALLMSGLEYMASAGLRVLVFARQKMGPGVDIYLVGAQMPVLETIEMTGFQYSVIIVDEYDAAVIEAA